jgi:hypothetical protein
MFCSLLAGQGEFDTVQKSLIFGKNTFIECPKGYNFSVGWFAPQVVFFREAGKHHKKENIFVVF